MTGLFDQFAIVRTLHHFAYGQNIVLFCPKGTHDRKVTALVGQETQRCSVHPGVATKMVSCAIDSAA
jgi:hypothetical protein